MPQARAPLQVGAPFAAPGQSAAVQQLPLGMHAPAHGL
jgi:hypothetical protein